MTTPNPKFPTGLPPSRGPASSNRTPGHTSSSRSNVVPPGVPGKRGVPQSNKFSAPADSSGVETREKEYSDEEHHTESDRGYEDEPQFRPEHGEEPEIKSRKPRFGYKHTDEEDNQDEGIENEEDTPKNLMSLSESLMAMKNLRSNFQSFQFEAEAEEHDDEHIDRANDEYEDEDYVKVESGEEENIQRTEEDMEPEEEHYEEEDYYERARASGSLKGVKDHYIEKIHEEPYEESHKDAEEEIDRPLITEEDKEEGGYIHSIPDDVVPVTSNQDLQEPLIKHDKPEEEEDEKIEREEPPKEEHKHHELQLPSKKEDEEVRRSLQKSQDLGAVKDKVQEERDRFFEELEGVPSHIGVAPKQTEEEQPPKSPARDEPLRKSDNYEPPQVEIAKEESPLKIKHEEPQKEEEPQQKEESEEKPDVPPPIFGLPAPRRNMPPQRGHGPPHRGGVPPRGGIPGQRVNIPPTRVNVPPQREVESPQVEEKPLQIAEVPQREEPVKAEPEVQHKEIISSPTKHEVPEKEEKPVQQIVEPPQREKEVQEAPEKEELPPIGGGAQIQRRNVPPQREAPVQAPKFFVPSSQPENVNKQPVRFPQQQAFVPSGPSAQRTQSDAEYEAMVVANAKDSSDNTLLVRLKNVEIELKKEKKKNELLESERERLVVESKDLKQQVLDLKSQLEHSNRSQGSESVSHREQETLEKLRQELKTTVEGSRLVTEHSNKIIGESAKYKQEMEALVNSLEEEKRQLQKSVLELKAQVHEEQLKVETQHQKTEFFERKAKEFEESFDMVHRQLNERIETLQRLTSINNNVQAAIEGLPRIDAFLAKLQPPSNTVAVQTISSQHTFSKSLSREPGSSSPTQQPTLFSGTKAPQTISASPQVKEPAFSNPFKSGAATTEKKQVKAKEPAHEFTLPSQIEEEPKPKKDFSSKPGKTFESEQKKTLPKEDEVVVSQSSDWFESVFTTQTVSKPKETLKATVQTSEPKVQEEKEKSSAAKKEKVTSSSKPSLQADDFFKDIIVPDVKTSFVPESKVKSTVKVASPVQISKEPEMAESGGWGFDAPEVKEKEKEKSSAAKKEKVTSSSKPSLQADDFFKDIIIPDVKSTFVPEAKINSPVKTTSPVRASKDSDIVESGGWGFDAPEEKEKEKSSTAKKEKVTSSSKPSLQADDFFKDIIVPDVKSSFVPEPKIKSPVKTSSPVQTSKELEIVETGGWGFDVPEVKEKEKEKSSAAKKEKVTSSSKPSLQADDFFKDIIVPDVKSSFVPEPKSSTEPKIKSPIKTSSPVQTSKELEIVETGGWGFDPLEEKEPSEAQTPEPSKPKPFQKEQPSKPEVAKSAAFTITKEEPKPEPKTETKASKPGLNLPPAKSVVPQFGKTTTSTEQGPKKFGSIILPKAGTSDKEKSTPGLNLAGIQTKSGTRYAPNKKAMEQNLISVESDNFFGELGLGDSSAKVDPFKGSLRESTSSLRTSQQGGDMFSQPVVKKKVVQ